MRVVGPEELNAYCNGPKARLEEQVVGPEVEVVRDLNAYCDGPKAKMLSCHDTKLQKFESLIDHPHQTATNTTTNNNDNKQQ